MPVIIHYLEWLKGSTKKDRSCDLPNLKNTLYNWTATCSHEPSTTILWDYSYIVSRNRNNTAIAQRDQSHIIKHHAGCLAILYIPTGQCLMIMYFLLFWVFGGFCWGFCYFISFCWFLVEFWCGAFVLLVFLGGMNIYMCTHCLF